MAHTYATRSPRTLLRGLPLKFGSLLVLLVLGVLIGNWLIFQQARAVLFRDVEQRGIWGARNLAHDAWNALHTGNIQDLRERVNALLRHDDVVYVGVANQEHTLLISSGSPIAPQASVLPELPRTACRAAEPLVKSAIIFETSVLLVSVPIVPLTDVRPDNAAAIQAQCAGTLHLGLSLAQVDRRLFHLLVTLILVCAYAPVIGVLAYRLATRQSLRPMAHSIATLQRLTHGDFRADYESPDPAGMSAHDPLLSSPPGTDRMVRTLTQFAHRVRTWLGRLKETGAQLTMMTGKNAAIAEDLAGAAQQHAATCSQAAAALETSRDAFDAIAADAAWIAATAAGTADTAHNLEQIVAQTLTVMRELSDQTTRNSKPIGQLGETFSQIGAVVNMINTIADQTRMIAFNASIEAAGAGESGGRFAIVATEVRRLANTVVEALDEIQELVASIQAAASELTLSSETGARNVKQALTLIGATGDAARDMARTLETIARTAQHVAQTTEQYQETQHTMLKEMTGLRDLARHSVMVGAQASDIARRMQQLAGELEEALRVIRM